jgi:hypothetical protein
MALLFRFFLNNKKTTNAPNSLFEAMMGAFFMFR